MTRERVISYYDDHNIHGGLRDSRLSKLYYFNPVETTSAFLRPNQHFVHCRYFTAKFRDSQPKKQEKQSGWLKALATVPTDQMTIHFGEFKRRKLRCHTCGETLCSACGTRMQNYREKMTDAGLMSKLIFDTLDDKYDTAVIVTGDADMVPAIKDILQRYPDKKIIVAFPLGRYSKELARVATDAFRINETMLRLSQFPDRIVANGEIIERPEPWYEDKPLKELGSQEDH